MIEYFERPDGLGPVNGYSHAASGAGRLVAVSGQLPVDVHGALVDSSGGFAQARQVFANLGTALAAAGAGRQDLLRLTFFLTDLADLPAVREARDKFLGDRPPSRPPMPATARVGSAHATAPSSCVPPWRVRWTTASP